MEKNKDDSHSNGKSSTPFSQTYFYWTELSLNSGILLKPVSTRTLDKEGMLNTFFLQRHWMLLSGVQNSPLEEDLKEFIQWNQQEH